MNNKAIHKTIMTVIFALLVPFMTLELLLKRNSDVLSSIRLSYQITLFAVDLGCKRSVQPLK